MGSSSALLSELLAGAVLFLAGVSSVDCVTGASPVPPLAFGI